MRAALAETADAVVEMQDKLITGVHLGSGGFLLIGVANRAIVRTSIAYRLSIGQVGKFFAERLVVPLILSLGGNCECHEVLS